jgi:hypothetical protein
VSPRSKKRSGRSTTCSGNSRPCVRVRTTRPHARSSAASC